METTWVDRIEECVIELLYAAHDCGPEGPAQMLKLMADVLNELSANARGRGL